MQSENKQIIKIKNKNFSGNEGRKVPQSSDTIMLKKRMN